MYYDKQPLEARRSTHIMYNKNNHDATTERRAVTLVPILQVTHEKPTAGVRKSILEIINSQFSFSFFR